MKQELQATAAALRAKTYKSVKTEWMPVNPCPCGAIRYPDGHKCNAEDGECSPLAYYEGAVDYQGKLLECLIARPTLMNLTQETVIRVIYISELESMLKQLRQSIMDKSIKEADNGQLIDRGSFAKYVEKKNG